jgi:predicted Holliday junction resolvase-like endonuclease
MDILSFILGIALVVVIGVSIVAVISFVKVRKIERQIEHLESEIFRALQDQISDTNRRMEELGNSVFSTLDSRLDKLENKLITKK